MTCECACHTGGTHKPTCTVDRGSSGVPGLKSCSPCDYNERAEQSERNCINGCRSKPTNEGETPVPRPATRGRLCGGCFHRLEDWLRDIPVDYALLPMALTSGGSQRYDGSTRTKQPEAPAPIRLDIAALADRRRDEPRIALPDVDNPAHLATLGRRRDTGLREPGDELWYELPDIPDVVATLHTWAEQLRCDLDPTREAL